MQKQLYNWKRFWCPREGKIALSDGGYLYDPNGKWGNAFNPDVVPFENIVEIPCLVLLGEPGIGKTSAVEYEKNAIEKSASEKGHRTFFKNLHSYRNEDRLVREVFESEEFISWHNSDDVIHLFLDSLDECLLGIRTVATLLAEKLKDCDIKRMYLRIACRTADWPQQLETELKELWGKEKVKVYELSPLRRADVVEAAQATHIDPDEFISEVARVDAVPLTIKPITLKFLLSSYQKEQLPSRKEELYFKGCMRLCTEFNENRKSAGYKGKLDPEHRFIVAARIAAVTVFSNRYAVWRGDEIEAPEEDIVLSELVYGSERINDQDVPVTTTSIEDVLSTGLFSARGELELGWAHQSYVEFLAAWYLKHHDVSLEQIISLIVHPGDPDGKLVPQLHAVVAWLAGMRLDVFREIIKRDCEVLLRSDTDATNERDKEELVGSFLRLYEKEEFLSPWNGNYDSYIKLMHPGLVDQLRPYVEDIQYVFNARVVAINIAESCGLSVLQDSLVKLVLNPSESIVLRSEAAHTISMIGDSSARNRLKTLLDSKIEDDKDDELKGNILRALWPDQITAADLFATLKPSKKRSHYGAYKRFIFNGIASKLKVCDLPIALCWIEKRVPWRETAYTFDTLTEQLFLKAWENLYSPGVLHGFTKAVLAVLKHDGNAVKSKSVFAIAVKDDEANRRSVIKEAILIIAAWTDSKDISRVIHGLVWSSGESIVVSEDMTWLADQLKNAKSADEEQVIITLIQGIFDPNNLRHVSAVYDIYTSNSRFEEPFNDYFQPILLGLPEAEHLKAQHYELEDLRKQRQRPLVDPPPGDRMLVALADMESGNINAWLNLTNAMALNLDGYAQLSQWEPDLTVFPGWDASDDEVKMRIIDAAKEYTLQGSPDTEKWLNTDKINYTAIDGYRAICLLRVADRNFIDGLSVEIWQKWAPIIMVFPVSGGTDAPEVHDELRRLAYKKTPTEMTEIAIILIDQENKSEQNYLFVLYRLECFWDKALSDVLSEKVKDKKLRPACMGQLLSELLKRNSRVAREFAESLVALSVSRDKDERDGSIRAASALIINTEDAGWSVVWPAMMSETPFGKDVIQQVAGNSIYGESFVGKLSILELADLFIWLMKEFPEIEAGTDDNGEMGRKFNPLDNIWRLKSTILDLLKIDGSEAACSEIERISTELDNPDWLRRALNEAVEVKIKNAWKPPKSEEIINLAKNRDIRLVQNGDQLLNVVIESLKRLEVAFQDETPAAIDVWSESETKGKFRPMQEETLSDRIKRHLDEELNARGIIFNREVVIKRVGDGQRTDIHVDAVAKDEKLATYGTLKVIIEVKGCWNPNLMKDMKNQLVKRYLKDNRCNHGLYVVGSYYCEKWDGNNDSRKARCKNRTEEKLQPFVDNQAAQLSTHEGKTIKALVINVAL